MKPGRHPLCDSFAERTARVVVPCDALERFLRSRLQEPETLWPGLTVDPSRFLDVLALHLPPEGEPETALGALRTAELYLCVALGDGEPTALKTFDRFVLPAALRATRPLRMDSDWADEIRQQIRERLLVARAPAAPLITQYSGRGSLLSWLSAVAFRTGLNAQRSERCRLSLSEAFLGESQSPVEAPSQEWELLRVQYGDAVRTVFEGAVRTLSPRQRALLRLRHTEQLDLEQLGRVYRVHVSTVKRWLQQARTQLLDQTRAGLLARLNLAPSELDSLLQRAVSLFELSIGSFLTESADDQPNSVSRSPTPQ